jgi:WD40 repeat protein
LDENLQHDAALRRLIEAVVNDEATDAQRQELEERLLVDEEARQVWLNYDNLHAGLGRLFLAGEAQPLAEDEIADFALLASREELLKAARRRSRFGWWGFALAGCLFVALVYQLAWLRPESARKLAASPLVVQVSGDAQVQAADGSWHSLAGNRTLLPGEMLQTQDREHRVELRYADGTQIVLLGSSQLAIGQTPHGGKQLNLLAGLLQADVAPQPSGSPLMIITPQAAVRVLGTRFELASDEQDGTRLDLESGRVQLARGNEMPLSIEPNSIAIVPASADPIQVSPRPAIVSTPLRETNFRGLRSLAYAADGQTIVAATRWQGVYWYPDDRMEVLPLSPKGSKNIHWRQQVNSLVAFLDGQEREIVIWNGETRQPLRVFDEAAQLPRLFRHRPERPKDWTPIGDVGLVSPHADWLVFQVNREFRLWQAEGERWPTFVRNYDGKFIGALASSPDAQTLAVAVRRGQVDLIDLMSEEVATTWSIRQQVPFAMEFSADGKHLAVALAGHVEVRDASTGALLADFRQPGLPFLKVAISADGRYVAAASQGNRVWLWDTLTKSELPLLEIGASVQDLAFPPSGNHLAVLSRGGQLSQWEVTSAASPEQVSERKASAP